MTRYFIVSFRWWYNNTDSGFGDITITCESFPGKKDLNKKVKETVANKFNWTDLNAVTVAILNLIELNEEDHNNWVEN